MSDKFFNDNDECYLKWRGIAHNPFLVKIENGKVQGFDVDRVTGDLTKNGKVEGWLVK